MKSFKEFEGKITRYLLFIAIAGFSISFSSCGTILGGQVQTCQKRKPSMDHREVRAFAFAGDLLLAPIALPIDFYTGAIYKPCAHYMTETINKKELRRQGISYRKRR